MNTEQMLQVIGESLDQIEEKYGYEFTREEAQQIAAAILENMEEAWGNQATPTTDYSTLSQRTKDIQARKAKAQASAIKHRGGKRKDNTVGDYIPQQFSLSKRNAPLTVKKEEVELEESTLVDAVSRILNG